MIRPLAAEFPPNIITPNLETVIIQAKGYSLVCILLEPAARPQFAWLNILQVFLIQPEIVAQFMDNRKTNLSADLGLGGANCFDIFLIKNDVVWSGRQVKYALPGGGHSVEDTQK